MNCTTFSIPSCAVTKTWIQRPDAKRSSAVSLNGGSKPTKTFWKRFGSKRKSTTTKAVGERLDFLVWRLLETRFLIPNWNEVGFAQNKQTETVENPQRYSLVGKAVFEVLHELLFKADGSKNLTAVYEEIFRHCLERIKARLWRGEWRIVNVARKFNRKKGDARGLVYVATRNQTRDFLEQRGDGLYPTHSNCDVYRQQIRAFQEQKPDAFKLSVRSALDEVVESLPPERSLAFLIRYVDPAMWHAIEFDRITKQFAPDESSAESLLGEIRKRQLASRCIEVCESKLEHLEHLHRKSREALERYMCDVQGVSEQAAEAKIHKVEEQSTSRKFGEIKADLERANSEPNRLTAELQNACKRVSKQQGYLAKARKEHNMLAGGNQDLLQLFADALEVDREVVEGWIEEAIRRFKKLLPPQFQE